MPEPDYKQRLEAYFALCEAESSRSLDKYLDRVFIDTKPQPKRLGEVCEPWQKERHEKLVPVLEHAAGVRESYSGNRCYWLECARGQDKTSGLARLCNWLLTYSKIPLNILACAADKDQSRLLFMSMETQANLPQNRWFGSKLKFLTSSVEGPGGKLTILASDGDTNQGQLPDLLIADEITIWRKRSLWDSLYSTGLKRAGTFCCLVITNCGTLGTWSWELRETVRTSPERWSFYAQEPFTYPVSWMTKEVIDGERKFLSKSEAARLLDSVWIEPNAASKYLHLEEVLPCVGTPLPPPLQATVILSLDYGTGTEEEGVELTKDRAAAAVTWWNGEKVQTYEVACWKSDTEVPISTLVNWTEERLLKYPNAIIVADRYQLLSELQKWEARGVQVERIKFKSGEYNAALALHLKNSIRNKGIVFAADAGQLGEENLVTELVALLEVKKSYGIRFENARTEHDDRAFVVAVGALRACQTDPPPSRTVEPKPPQQVYPFSSNPLARLGSLTWAQEKNLYGMSSPSQERFVQL
jgi:hypothetical protein